MATRLTVEQRQRRDELRERGLRECSRCMVIKDLDKFYKTSKPHLDGYESTCRECILQRKRERRVDKPLQHETWLRRYGLTSARFEEILAAQGGGCAICGTPACATGRALSVDHDHSCCPGRTSCGSCVRGILCHSCNVAIGYLQDRADLADKAAHYLRSSPDA